MASGRSTSGQRVAGVLYTGTETGLLVWGATATDGVLSIGLAVFSVLAGLATLGHAAK